uniref:Uncharacterized protein n=1 Tax=Meloidogyne enterolobii TaxID=390850 RepID=A0A6V7U3E9_MELEN|nr:unnamed protein product [Meloidogyne enterolobii]
MAFSYAKFFGVTTIADTCADATIADDVRGYYNYGRQIRTTS